jgi:hypothetical protein
VSKVELLAGPNPISCAFTQDGTTLTVTLPKTEPTIADIKVYAFRITHDKTWTNDDDSGIFFHGWQHELGRPGAFNNDWNHTEAAGDTCRLTFSGTGIEYIAEKGADFGDVMVTLDNGPAKTVSLKGSGIQQVVYKATDLKAGNHTLTLVCKGNGRINVDAFKVIGGQIKVEGFKVATIGVDAILAPSEPGQNPSDVKPKAKIDKIKHVGEQCFRANPLYGIWPQIGERPNEQTQRFSRRRFAVGIAGVPFLGMPGRSAPEICCQAGGWRTGEELREPAGLGEAFMLLVVAQRQCRQGGDHAGHGGVPRQGDGLGAAGLQRQLGRLLRASRAGVPVR